MLEVRFADSLELHFVREGSRLKAGSEVLSM
jgi:hypothetical protein